MKHGAFTILTVASVGAVNLLTMIMINHRNLEKAIAYHKSVLLAPTY